MFDSDFTGATWVSHEPSIVGSYDCKAMKALYDSEVDKVEYPEFVGWLWDMERSCTFYRHASKQV